jgi:hypothetical protein
MAYDFDGTSAQLLSVGSAPVTNSPLTLFGRGNPEAVFTTGRVVQLFELVTGRGFGLNATGGTFPLQMRFDVTTAGGTGSATIAGALAQNTWYATTAVEESTASRYVFADTTKSTQNTTSLTYPTINRLSIGAIGANAWNGLLAEIAVWDVALTDDEITSLARGFKPSRIRPQNLQFYAPIVRGLQDVRGGRAITNNGSVPVADHPRVY